MHRLGINYLIEQFVHIYFVHLYNALARISGQPAADYDSAVGGTAAVTGGPRVRSIIRPEKTHKPSAVHLYHDNMLRVVVL